MQTKIFLPICPAKTISSSNTKFVSVTHENTAIDKLILGAPENKSLHTSNSVKALSKSHADVPPVVLPKNVSPMTTKDQVISTSANLDGNEMQKLNSFNMRTQQLLMKPKMADQKLFILVRLVCLVQMTVPKPLAIVALLPIFRNTFHSPDSVDVIRNEHHYTDHWSCKPGQKPVIIVDQLLYSILL